MAAEKHWIWGSKNGVRWFIYRCFCVVLSECWDRKKRCDTGRTRKQEAVQGHKNRKQEHAPIRWSSAVSPSLSDYLLSSELQRERLERSKAFVSSTVVHRKQKGVMLQVDLQASGVCLAQ